MPKCFSLTASRSWCLRSVLTISGLRSTIIDLGDGTVMHCWVPKNRKGKKPDLVLIHGFGTNATWQWRDTVCVMMTHFNVYVPDLVFFGDSYTTRPERTESFQAQCVMRLMEAHSVRRMSLVGLSYGGFVAYSIAVQFKDAVDKVVICCSGVCLEEKDLKDGLFPVEDVEEAARILVPQTAEKMRELLHITFVKPPNSKRLPSCLINDFIEEMCVEHAQEKSELLHAIPKDRKLSDLPKITQPTLIIWGDQDKIFPLELGHRLKRHLAENARLVVIKNSGHAFTFEKTKEFLKHLKSFLLDSSSHPQPSSIANHDDHNII